MPTSAREDNASFVNALVASSDIAKGTTGQEALQAGLVKMEKVAKSSVPPSIISDVNDLDGKVAASRIDTKQFITSQTFVSAEDGVGGAFAQAIANQDLVAVTVNVDAERGVANRSSRVTTSTLRRARSTRTGTRRRTTSCRT